MIWAWQSTLGATHLMALQFWRMASASMGVRVGRPPAPELMPATIDVRGIHLDDIGAQAGDGLLDGIGGAAADLHHGDDGGDADDDAQTGQQRPHDVPAQGAQRHPKGSMNWSFISRLPALRQRNCGTNGFCVPPCAVSVVLAGDHLLALLQVSARDRRADPVRSSDLHLHGPDELAVLHPDGAGAFLRSFARFEGLVCRRIAWRRSAWIWERASGEISASEDGDQRNAALGTSSALVSLRTTK